MFSCKYLFAYLRVTCNDTNYDLVFNRFYLDEKYNVNCILLCPQIEIYDNSLIERKGELKREESPYTKNYPNTSADNEKSKEEDGGSVYYNFGIDLLNLTSKEIAEKFLNFVIESEEKKKADNKA